jgi:hypothetical protein
VLVLAGVWLGFAPLVFGLPSGGPNTARLVNDATVGGLLALIGAVMALGRPPTVVLNVPAMALGSWMVIGPPVMDLADGSRAAGWNDASVGLFAALVGSVNAIVTGNRPVPADPG